MIALICLVVLAAAAALIAYLRTSAARVVRSRPPAALTVVWGEGRVLLPASELTRAPGQYGLWVSPRESRTTSRTGIALTGHLLVGEVVGEDRAGGRIARELLSATGLDLQGTAAGVFSGQLYPGPEAVAPGHWADVLVETPAGLCPAWLIEPDAPRLGATWAVHVHGFGTTRRTALRTVPVSGSLGLRSLVVTFRGDGEGPALPGAASTLGASEWQDVDAAIGYAIKRGAERVVLFAWSMGAAAAFLAAVRSRHSARIAAVVAIAPVTDWTAVIRAGARSAHLPAVLGSVTAWGLSLPPVTRSLGLAKPIRLSELARAAQETAERIPILLLHSELDPLVPFSASRRFADAHRPLVSLVPFRTVGHAWEMNAERAAFESAIATWLSATL